MGPRRVGFSYIVPERIGDVQSHRWRKYCRRLFDSVHRDIKRSRMRFGGEGKWAMSNVQTPPVPSQTRGMSPVAVNSIISSLVTIAGVVLVIISGGFVYL